MKILLLFVILGGEIYLITGLIFVSAFGVTNLLANKNTEINPSTNFMKIYLEDIFNTETNVPYTENIKYEALYLDDVNKEILLQIRDERELTGDKTAPELFSQLITNNTIELYDGEIFSVKIEVIENSMEELNSINSFLVNNFDWETYGVIGMGVHIPTNVIEITVLDNFNLEYIKKHIIEFLTTEYRIENEDYYSNLISLKPSPEITTQIGVLKRRFGNRDEYSSKSFDYIRKQNKFWQWIL